MTKTLGQVAYEAWHLEHMCPGLTAPYNWGQEYPDGRKAWQAAAEAVVMATTVELILLPQKRAVIEAAKAFVETTGGGKAYIAEWWRLKEAIEALQEVEGD